MKVLSWINFLLGLWLIVAGFALAASEAAMASEIVLGIIIAVLAIASAMGRPSAVLSWVLAIAGLWTLVAPTVIDYGGGHQTAQINDIIVGIVVLGLAGMNALFRQSLVLPHSHTHA